jgi:hypothetical protein
MEPVEDPGASQLTVLDGFCKFTSVVADHGHALIARHTFPAEELIESRCSRGDFPVHIRIQFWRTIGERCPSGDDIHVAARASP